MTTNSGTGILLEFHHIVKFPTDICLGNGGMVTVSTVVSSPEIEDFSQNLMVGYINLYGSTKERRWSAITELIFFFSSPEEALDVQGERTNFEIYSNALLKKTSPIKNTGIHWIQLCVGSEYKAFLNDNPTVVVGFLHVCWQFILISSCTTRKGG